MIDKEDVELISCVYGNIECIYFNEEMEDLLKTLY